MYGTFLNNAWLQHNSLNRTWGSQGDDGADGCLVGSSAVQTGTNLPTFPKCLLSPWPGWHYNPEYSHIHNTLHKAWESQHVKRLCMYWMSMARQHFGEFCDKQQNRSYYFITDDTWVTRDRWGLSSMQSILRSSRCLLCCRRNTYAARVDLDCIQST
jgi:hypothetical protein